MDLAFRDLAKTILGDHLDEIVLALQHDNRRCRIHTGDMLLSELTSCFQKLKLQFGKERRRDRYRLLLDGMPMIPGLPIDPYRYFFLTYKQMRQIFDEQLQTLKALVWSQLTRIMTRLKDPQASSAITGAAGLSPTASSGSILFDVFRE